MARTILCVDDSAGIRQMVKLTLTRAGYDVVEAVDGCEGVAKACAGGVDLILTDLRMPNMDGIAMVRALTSRVDIPVVFLTSETDEAKKDEAKAAGATAWIAKPFQKEQLLHVVKQVLG